VAEVKWIKIVTDIFDDDKMRLIDKMPEADTIIVIWFKILCLAGRTNQGGLLLLNNKIYYTDEMLSDLFNRPLSTVRMALKVFERFEMIEMINTAYYISNWEKHQNVEGLDKVREQTRIRVNKHRQKLLDSNVTCNVTVTQGNATDKDIDKELDIDIKNNIVSAEPTPYTQIQQLFNQLCTTLPKVKNIKDNRKKSFNSRWKEYQDIEFWTQLFTEVNESDFLSGRSGAWTGCSFDWIIKPNNLQKIIEGNYKNKSGVAKGNQKQNGFHNFEPRKYDSKSLEEQLLEKSRGELT
jgi:predicted phage replisome organizer